MSEQILTVDRQKLMDLITEVAEQEDARLRTIIVQKEDELAEATPAQQIKQWYEEKIFPRIDDGTITYDPPTRNWVAVRGTPEVSPRPLWFADLAAAEAAANAAIDQRDRTAKRYQTALALLEITTTETVDIPVSEYEKLLNGRFAY